MPLILVVEPDARHAAQVVAMARRHLQAEVVTADSADRAVAALAGRVPDVLLMSSLLPRPDEAAVAAWLRDLGPAAAHVQELTIPILAATAAPAPKRREVLSALRGRRRRSAAPDGCELDVFARQIAMYMELASAARKLAEPTPHQEAPEIQAAIAPEIRAALVEPELPPAVYAEAEIVAELEIVPITAAPLEGIVAEDEGCWVPISLEEVCKAPLSAPEKVWELVAPLAPEPAPQPVAIAAPAPSIPRAEPKNPRPEPKKKDRKPAGSKPAQDEWGFFDPEQCGFAALVAKLDEITEDNNAEHTSPDTTVRLLIAY